MAPTKQPPKPILQQSIESLEIKVHERLNEFGDKIDGRLETLEKRINDRFDEFCERIDKTSNFMATALLGASHDGQGGLFQRVDVLETKEKFRGRLLWGAWTGIVTIAGSIIATYWGVMKAFIFGK